MHSVPSGPSFYAAFPSSTLTGQFVGTRSSGKIWKILFKDFVKVFVRIKVSIKNHKLANFWKTGQSGKQEKSVQISKNVYVDVSSMYRK